MENAEVARTVERLADLLEAQKASPFRVQAWRAAVQKIRAAKEPLALVALHEGLPGLQTELNVGPGIASALRELLGTGRLRMLERLEGHMAPEDLFLTVPGIGPTLAGAVHHKYGLETLEELEAAAHDGRLAKVAGFGARRVKLVTELQGPLAGKRVVRGREAECAALYGSQGSRVPAEVSTAPG